MKSIWMILMVGLCMESIASNNPSKKPLPEVQNIEAIISEAIKVRSAYVEGEKSKAYDFPGLNFIDDDPVGVQDKMEDVYKITKDYVQNEKVKQVIAAVEGLDVGRMISVLSGSELVKLPLGIVKTIGSTQYTVIFDSAKFFPDYAEVKTYARIKNDKYDLCFGAEGVKFSYDGGIIGDATLALYGDFAVPMKSEKVAVVFNRFQPQDNGADFGSYVTFDCDGFVEARLDIDVILSREWVLPTNSVGEVLGGNQRVRANAAATVRALDDFVAEVSMPYFTLTKDTSVAVLVDRAIFDLSETNNAPGFEHPLVYNFETGKYESPPPPEERPLWTGFYLGKLEFVLPNVFNDKSDLPLIVGAEKLYIDQKGVSGKVYADNAIPIETGTIGESDWAFSVDHVGVDLNYNRIVSFDFNGRLNIPISEETHRLTYAAEAIPSQQYYNLTVGLDSVMAFPIFKAAEVKLNPGTAVSVTVKEGEFEPHAMLCGGMYIKLGGSDDDTSKVSLDMGGVEFHKLIIRDTMPYLGLSENGGSITLLLDPVLNNSPVNINTLSLTNLGQDRVKLGFAVEVNLQNSDDGGGKTGGAFGILGEYREENGKSKWRYAGVETDAMRVEIIMGTYAWIEGGLEFYKGDETWGNGFYGYLNGGFIGMVDEGEKIGPESDYKLNLRASARFGTKFPETPESYKYWSLDLYVSSDEYSVPLFTPISANGIGGGVYHHMKMIGYDTRAMAEDNKNPYSGIVYEPNDLILIGIKFSLGFLIDGVDGFKGNITLELAIDTNFALQNIMIYGNGEFVNDLFEVSAESRLGKLKSKFEDALGDIELQAQSDKEDKITAAMMIYMDFEKGFELHGSFGAYMDAAKGRITGEGHIDLYISNQRKHLYIGGYDGVVDMNNNPVGTNSISITIGEFQAYASFYLLTGNDLPPPPKVPYKITKLLDVSADSNNRGLLPNSDITPVAAGFAMGANLKINVDIKNSIVKFLLDAEAGYDISLLSNPSTSYCSNLGQTEHGVKGWRAQGQIYGFLRSTLESWFFGWHTLWNREVAFVIEGDLPNPSYLMIKGRYKNKRNKVKEFEKEVGTKCGNVILN